MGHGICVDSQAINKMIVRSRFRILRFDDLLDQLSGFIVFAKLDLKSGYNEIHICSRMHGRPHFRCVRGCMSGW